MVINKITKRWFCLIMLCALCIFNISCETKTNEKSNIEFNASSIALNSTAPPRTTITTSSVTTSVSTSCPITIISETLALTEETNGPSTGATIVNSTREASYSTTIRNSIINSITTRTKEKSISTSLSTSHTTTFVPKIGATTSTSSIHTTRTTSTTTTTTRAATSMSSVDTTQTTSMTTTTVTTITTTVPVVTETTSTQGQITTACSLEANAILLPNHEYPIPVEIAPATQWYVDNFEIVQDNGELFSTDQNIFLFGHVHRTFMCLDSISVGQEIVLWNDSVPKRYTVVVSTSGRLNDYNTDILSDEDGTSLVYGNMYDAVQHIRLITCRPALYGNTARWVVIAVEQ